MLTTVLGAAGFLLLYEATVVDSRTVPAARFAGAGAGSRLEFQATAYCKGETTASGAPVRSGVAAADPAVLPLGSIIQLDGLPDRYQGIYTVLDTGPKVQGRHVDVYMWSCHDALAFGRRSVKLTILRLGWNPKSIRPAR